MGQLANFLISADAVPLVFAEIILLFSWLFEGLARATMEIDEQDLPASSDVTLIDNEKRTILRCASDQVWRVSIITSVVFSLIAIVSLVYKVVSSGGVLLWASPFVVLSGLLAIVFLLKHKSPYELERPLCRYRWVNFYFLGNAVLFGLNLIVLYLSYIGTSGQSPNLRP
jgi:hypothetical protein